MTSDDIKGAAQHAADKAASSAQAADEQVGAAGSRAMDQAQALAGQVSDSAGDLYERAKDQVKGLSDRIPNSASGAYEVGQRAYLQGSEQIARQVSKQPVEALLLAGALGYLLGWATSRS